MNEYIKFNDLKKHLHCCLTTVRNKINQYEEIRELFVSYYYKDKNNAMRHSYKITKSNLEKYKEIIKKKKNLKKEKIYLNDSILECYNIKFDCKRCSSYKYCPADKPMQRIVLDCIEKGLLPKW